MKAKFYTYNKFINIIKSIPTEYDNYPIILSVNWDGNDYYIISTDLVGRRVKPIIYKCDDHQDTLKKSHRITKLGVIDGLNKCNGNHDINFIDTSNNEFYTLSDLNYAVGQNEIYFKIRRIG